LESPLGTGYSVAPPNYEYYEDIITNDLWRALKNWFELFPEYKPNDLWIYAEGYGGP